MTTFSDQTNLYREIILDHAKNPRHQKEVTGDYLTAYVKNPACGDEVRLFLKIDEGKINDVAHQTSGCSICVAATSMFSEHLKDNNIDKINEIIDNYLKMLEEANYNKDLLGDLVSLSGVSKLPARKRCATLCIKAYEEIVNKGDNDD